MASIYTEILGATARSFDWVNHSQPLNEVKAECIQPKAEDHVNPNPLFGTDDELKDGWMEKEGWMEEERWTEERMDGFSIHPLLCLVKHGRIGGNDSLLCLV